jgi:hypothetical protein
VSRVALVTAARADDGDQRGRRLLLQPGGIAWNDPKTLSAHRERRVDRRQGGNPMAAAYSVSKAAVGVLIKAIGKDVARIGVLVAAPRDHLAWPWSAWEVSAARDGLFSADAVSADPTVGRETIRFLECDDSRFRTPTEGPVGRTGVVAGP